jgi:hypothetical protein
MGQYRAGAWSQTARHGSDTAEELIVAPDLQTGLMHSYTRAAGDETWTRWPGVGFDAGYGLASPFTALRLYPLDGEKTPGEIDAAAGAPEPVVKVEAVFSPETVRRLLDAGISAVAGDAETRAALQAQLEPMVVTQTVTYWATDGGAFIARLQPCSQAGMTANRLPHWMSPGSSRTTAIPPSRWPRLPRSQMPLSSSPRLSRHPNLRSIPRPRCACAFSRTRACQPVRRR